MHNPAKYGKLKYVSQEKFLTLKTAVQRAYLGAIMIHLLNAAVMPNEGQYTLRQISLSEFRTRLREAAEAANFQSYIGYPETARLIEEIVGCPQLRYPAHKRRWMSVT